MRLTNNFDTTTDFKILNGHPYESLTVAEQQSIQMNVENLQAIRDWVGKPITVTSGLRSVTANLGIKGASKSSQHLFGEALDFVVKGDDEALDRIYEALINKTIKLPHAPSQVILEEFGGKKWMHLGLKSPRWIEESRLRLQYAIQNQDTVGQAKHNRKLTSTEFLATNDGKTYALIASRPYGDWA